MINGKGLVSHVLYLSNRLLTPGRASYDILLYLSVHKREAYDQLQYVFIEAQKGIKLTPWGVYFAS